VIKKNRGHNWADCGGEKGRKKQITLYGRWGGGGYLKSESKERYILYIHVSNKIKLFSVNCIILL